jgi:hypothetical protein
VVKLSERAFRREPPFDIIETLDLPSTLGRTLLHYEQGAAIELHVLTHKLNIICLQGEVNSSRYEETLRRIREIHSTGRLDPRPEFPMRLHADRKGGLAVLRKIKRELIASGWKRLKGGRFQKDLENFWIQLWFDPGTYTSNVSAFLAVGPPWTPLDPEEFFDIWMDKLLFFGPQGEFEENLRKFLIVVGRLEDGLKELLETCPPQKPNRCQALGP